MCWLPAAAPPCISTPTSAVDDEGRAVACPAWVPSTDEDLALDAHAVELVRLRAAVDRSRP
ncbi:MAG: hypothetical protein M0Z98_07615 [Actinomycetales bacterium]|nr:hypothetical protein [Actinomycetales bacterium]